jgi:hypothetical protein
MAVTDFSIGPERGFYRRQRGRSTRGSAHAIFFALRALPAARAVAPALRHALATMRLF